MLAGYCVLGLFLNLRLAWREVYLQNGIGWAFFHALPAKLALVGINVGQVILQGDGLVRANLHALETPNACNAAVLTCNTTLVGIHARHENSLALWPLFPQLYK